MADAIQVGAQWALIATVPDPGNCERWVGRWALYQDHGVAMEAVEPPNGTTSVSGATRSCASEAEARQIAEQDARRTEAVISGTYRD